VSVFRDSLRSFALQQARRRKSEIQLFIVPYSYTFDSSTHTLLIDNIEIVQEASRRTRRNASTTFHLHTYSPNPLWGSPDLLQLVV
jgi:hypothetical protein